MAIPILPELGGGELFIPVEKVRITKGVGLSERTPNDEEVTVSDKDSAENKRDGEDASELSPFGKNAGQNPAFGLSSYPGQPVISSASEGTVDQELEEVKIMATASSADGGDARSSNGEHKGNYTLLLANDRIETRTRFYDRQGTSQCQNFTRVQTSGTKQERH